MSKEKTGFSKSPVGEIFNQLGTTPRARSTRAAALFRRLRDGKGDAAEFNELATRFGVSQTDLQQDR